MYCLSQGKWACLNFTYHSLTSLSATLLDVCNVFSQGNDGEDDHDDDDDDVEDRASDDHDDGGDHILRYWLSH